MDLFIEPTITFEKLGAEVTLPEDPNSWPNEITQELFKQVPYVSDFEPHVVMDRVDAERGFGFGHVEVANKTEVQQGTSEQSIAAAGIRQAKIPIIIKDRKLQPFDVIVTEDASMLPLTEARLRQAIFRPQNFDVTSKTPGDMSMVGQLFPPSRQNYGGGGMMMGGGMGKEGTTKKASEHDEANRRKSSHRNGAGQLLGASLGASVGGLATHHHLNKVLQPKYRGAASIPLLLAGAAAGTRAGAHLGRKFDERRKKHASILQAILPTITADDYAHFYNELADTGMKAAFVKNAAATLPSLQLLGTCEPVDDTKVATGLIEGIQPSVVQLVREADGYRVKSANHRCWTVRQEAWDRKTAVQALGEKVVLAADLSGSATLSTGEGAAPPPEEVVEEQAGPIQDFGVYKVQDEEGNELTGHVFPNLIDVDGTALPLALFWNGEHTATQGDIVGVKISDEVPMVEGHPRGRGAFYDVQGEEPVATIPLTIKATLSGGEEGGGGGGVTLQAEAFDGRPISVMIQPNLAQVTMGENDTMLVPDTMKWLPLDDCEEIGLISGVETAEKMAHPTRALATVAIRAGGVDCFSIDGLPLLKIAAAHRSFLSTDDALFLLVGLGVRPDHAVTKLAEALDGSHPVEVKVGRHLVSAREAWEDAAKLAADRRAACCDLKVSLVKEAAVLPDPTAVDTVLSLGFINPDNAETFVSYLPEIEASQKKLCELLIATRLGLQEVPIPAIEKAVKMTEQVIEGLKVLAFQSN